MRKELMILIILLFLFSNFAFAEEEQEDVFHLGKIVITPSRLYQEYGQVSRATNLITQEEIEDKNPVKLGELLTDLPSALVQESGSLGAISSIRFRGATSKQTLILIDNMPMENFRDGFVDLTDYSVANIESIEVVRGPASSLYGSGAIGGTINIITKEGTTEIPTTTITGRYGTWQTHIYELTNSAKIDKFNYFLSAENANSQGFRDNLDYKAETYFGKIGLDLDENNSLDISGRLNFSEVGSPGSIHSPDLDNRTEKYQNYVNALLESNYFDKLNINLQGYMMLDRLAYTRTKYPTLDKDTHQTKSRALNLQTSYEILKNTNLMAGIEGKEFRLNSDTTGKHGATLRSLYALANFGYFDFLDLVGGIRVDDYSNFGTDEALSANAALKFGGWKIRGLFAQSYSAPTFNDLYWPDMVWAIGNPNLRIETGNTCEAGIENIFNTDIFKNFPLDIKSSATFFHTEMEDLIKWVYDTTTYKSKPINVTEAKIQGVELESEIHLIKNIKTTFNYTLTKTKDMKTERVLTYCPKHKFDFSFSYKHPWGIIGRFSGQYVSQAYRDDANNDSIKPYWIFGTDLYYDIDEQTRYFVNIDNMFNRTYEKSKGYPMPGFTITTGMRVRF